MTFIILNFIILIQLKIKDRNLLKIRQYEIKEKIFLLETS